MFALLVKQSAIQLRFDKVYENVNFSLKAGLKNF